MSYTVESLNKDITEEKLEGLKYPFYYNKNKCFRDDYMVYTVLAAVNHGFKSNVWMTYAQGKALGLKVKRGEKAFDLQYSKKCRTWHWCLFNLDQFEGNKDSIHPNVGAINIPKFFDQYHETFPIFG